MSVSEKNCAYCGLDTTLTNEHVFPDCFLRAIPPFLSIAKTPQGDKAIIADLQLRDVCGDCNNKLLSVLDTYFCELNSQFFSHIVRSGDRVRFQYDFDLLLRSLLKICYNTTRARKWPIEPWGEIPLYILGSRSRPASIHLYLQLQIPTPVNETTLAQDPNAKEFMPFPIRCYLRNRPGEPWAIWIMWLSVWSYRFFVMWENESVSSLDRTRILRDQIKRTKGLYELPENGDRVLYSSSVSVLDEIDTDPAFFPQLKLVREFKRKRGLH